MKGSPSLVPPVIEHLDNRGVTDAGGGAGFLQHAVGGAGDLPAELAVHDLECDVDVQGEVFGHPNRTMPPSPSRRTSSYFCSTDARRVRNGGRAREPRRMWSPTPMRGR